MAVPTYDKLFNPLLIAIRALGGSGSVSEIDEKVAVVMGLSDDDINEIHRANRTKLSYRLAWSRNYLKRYGLLENSSRGIWALTPKGVETNEVDEEEVKHKVRALEEETDIEEEVEEGREPENQVSQLWEEKMLTKIQELSPEAFERLCQRLLREAGFIQVEVTGRTGDGGIDGKGTMRIGGFLTFRIVFQCKRYTGSVSTQQVRDFRGAMDGRADKGLLITTGTFTQDAKREAVRDGAQPVDLVDGNELINKMRELGLGVKITTEEKVQLNDDWFDDFE